MATLKDQGTSAWHNINLAYDHFKYIHFQTLPLRITHMNNFQGQIPLT